MLFKITPTLNNAYRIIPSFSNAIQDKTNIQQYYLGKRRPLAMVYMITPPFNNAIYDNITLKQCYTTGKQHPVAMLFNIAKIFNILYLKQSVIGFSCGIS